MIVRYSDYVENVRYSDISSKKDGSLDSYDYDAINASILNIMLTIPGTIPFNYEFGAGVGLFIFVKFSGDSGVIDDIRDIDVNCLVFSIECNFY